jgi:hypothetical protein
MCIVFIGAGIGKMCTGMEKGEVFSNKTKGISMF